jgi:hypothetical protein
MSVASSSDAVALARFGSLHWPASAASAGMLIEACLANRGEPGPKLFGELCVLRPFAFRTCARAAAGWPEAEHTSARAAAHVG